MPGIPWPSWDGSRMEALEWAAAAIDDAAIALLRNERGVRVEDYLCALAAATGEAALADAGLFDIEATDLTPGAAVFGDEINRMLTGDATVLADVPADSVVGVLRDRLVPGTVAAEDFGPLKRLYELVPREVGSVPWGEVALTVPDDHRPSVQPLRLAFELRPAVVAAVGDQGRRVPCALALAGGIERTREAIDVRIGLTLALEVVFGMAKTVPMSLRRFEETHHPASNGEAP
jgi:hypothetical protein